MVAKELEIQKLERRFGAADLGIARGSLCGGPSGESMLWKRGRQIVVGYFRDAR